MKLLGEKDEVIYEEKEISDFMSKTFDKRQLRRRRNPESQSLEKPKITRSQPKDQQRYVTIFNLACNRFQRAQAGKLYQKMSQYPAFQKEADIFFGFYHLKLKTELTLKEFLDSIHKGKEIARARLSQHKRSVVAEISRESTKHSSFDSQVSPIIINKLFQKYDLNHDGFIDLEELKYGLRNAITKNGIESLFEQYDTDKNKVLDKEELTNLFVEQLTEDNL